MTEIHNLVGHRRKPHDSPFPDYGLPIPVWIKAICPECGKMAIIRQCYTCKRLMCEECYPEHQLGCLDKKESKK